jgi:uncharacterized membrane protein YsdA (DUF1294 family)
MVLCGKVGFIMGKNICKSKTARHFLVEVFYISIFNTFYEMGCGIYGKDNLWPCVGGTR